MQNLMEIVQKLCDGDILMKGCFMTLLSFMRVFLGTGKPRHFMQSIKSQVREYCAILSLNLGECVKAHNVVRTDKSLPLVYA